jgi:hypothetical protein
MNYKWMIVTFLLAFGPTAARADQWRFQVSSGQPLNLPTNLTIDQDGQTVVDETVHWISRPLKQPLYWALRISWEGDKAAWDLQLLHHKMHHPERGDPLQNFEVTHGFNILTLARRFMLNHFDVSVGGGVVIPHAEFLLNGRHYVDGGYGIGGPAFLAAVSRFLPLGQRLFLNAEAAGIAARARMTIEDTEVQVVSLALHLQAGIGVRF